MENLCLSLSLENLPNEEWRDISDFKGRYEISNYSRIKKIGEQDKIIRKHLIKGLFLARIKIGRKYKWVTPYRLATIAFLENEDNMPDVLHKDKINTNDMLENLYWGIREIKRNPRTGENHGRAVLNQAQVEEIREKHEQGYSLKELQFDYGVSIGCINGVLNKNWKAKSPE